MDGHLALRGQPGSEQSVVVMPFLGRSYCLLSDLHLKIPPSDPKAVCLELNIEWTDVGDASRKEKEGQVELGVALLGLCSTEHHGETWRHSVLSS